MTDHPETVVQIRVSEALKCEIATKAFHEGKTIRCFVLSALAAYGVDVDDDQLIDRRKTRKGSGR